MKVVIIDTACANLSSVAYAIQRCGYQPVISHDPTVILAADKLFLPGVGTANAAMEKLAQRQLIGLIQSCTQPILGICLGMQLLTKHSEEGHVDLLNLIDAPVTKMAYHGLPLPHSGWNRVTAVAGNPLFHGIAEQAHFYFVHGYAVPLCTNTIAQTQYGESFSAAIQKENFFGVQFHPERSGQAGAQLIKNFLELETR